jgi:hypothetical protein
VANRIEAAMRAMPDATPMELPGPTRRDLLELVG